MTRFTESLIFLSCLLALWFRLLTMKDIQSYISMIHIQLLPIYILIVFGIISAIIVLYRTLTFNGCPEAYEELKKEINDAKQDLEGKGFKFKK